MYVEQPLLQPLLIICHLLLELALAAYQATKYFYVIKDVFIVRRATR